MKGMLTSMTVKIQEQRVLVHTMSNMGRGKNTSIRKMFSSARKRDLTWLKIILQDQELT